MAARWPEELEMLLEDAFVLRDAQAVAELFEPDGVLARGGHRMGAAQGAAVVCAVGGTYCSDASRIVQAGRTALVVGSGCASVMHRGDDGSWRYTICLIDEGGQA